MFFSFMTEGSKDKEVPSFVSKTGSAVALMHVVFSPSSGLQSTMQRPYMEPEVRSLTISSSGLFFRLFAWLLFCFGFSCHLERRVNY